MEVYDQEVYLKNINSLKKKYKDIILKLDSLSKTKENLNIDVIEAKDKNKSMVIHHNDKSLYIHSKYRPVEEAGKWIKSLDINEESYIFIFGLGLGYHIKETAKKIGDKNKLIILEPNLEVFKKAIENIDLSDLFDKDNITFVINKEGITEAIWNYTNWNNIGNAIITNLPNYDKIFKVEVENFYQGVKDTINQRIIDKNTVFLFAGKWQENIIKNIPYVLESHSIKDFFGTFTNKPAVIVAAGPSLSKNIKQLQGLKEHAVIIAVGTALRPLLRNGIKPDFIISIDGGLPNYKHFEGLDYSDIPLVYEPILYPDILKEHKGEKILFLSDDYYISKLLNKYGIRTGILKMGSSVANVAFDFAVKLGADPVIFIGQDLAYTDDKTHAGGTVYENDRAGKDKNYLLVEDIHGDKVYTSKVLYGFLKWFEREIAKDTPGRLFIDATEGGAKITGTKIMTLKETRAEYCKKNIEVSKTINNILTGTKKLTYQQMNQIIDEYKDMQEELKEIRNICRKGENISNELLTIYQTNKYNNIKAIDNKISRLDKIDSEIRKRIESFNLIVFILEPLIYMTMSIKIEDKNDTTQQRGIKVAQKSTLLYQRLKEAIDYVQPLLRDVIKDLEKLMVKNNL